MNEFVVRCLKYLWVGGYLSLYIYSYLSLCLYAVLNPKFWSDAKFVQILRLCERVCVCGWRGRDHFTPKMWQLHKSIPSGWTWGTRGGRGYHGDGRIQETRDDIKECINRDWESEKEREVLPRGQKEVKQVNHFELLYEWVHDVCLCVWEREGQSVCMHVHCLCLGSHVILGVLEDSASGITLL